MSSFYCLFFNIYFQFSFYLLFYNNFLYQTLNTLVSCHHIMSVRGQICYLRVHQVCAFVSCGGAAKALTETLAWEIVVIQAIAYSLANTQRVCLMAITFSVKFWIISEESEWVTPNWKIFVLAGKLKCQIGAGWEPSWRTLCFSSASSPISSPFCLWPHGQCYTRWVQGPRRWVASASVIPSPGGRWEAMARARGKWGREVDDTERGEEKVNATGRRASVGEHNGKPLLLEGPCGAGRDP